MASTNRQRPAAADPVAADQPAGPASGPTAGPTAGEVRRRADARRSIAAILDAAVASLSRSPDVNMVEIARTAGVGRVTLYAHFPTKEALVDAVVAHAIAGADRTLNAIDTDTGPASAALARLTGTSWHILNQHRQLMLAGHTHLGPVRMRAHHDQVMDRVRHLITRGQTDGDIRTDLPTNWLITAFYALLHAAADDANAGRLDPAQAGDLATATITAALRPPS